MKRFFLGLLIVMLGWTGKEVSAQRIIGGVALGMNLTQVDGDEYYGFNQIGINVGPGIVLPFGKNKKWSVGMELLFSQKGSYHNGATDTTTYRLRLDYVEIPVIFSFTDKKIISAGAGFCYGQLVGARETEFGKRTETNLQGPYTLADLSVLADLQIRLYHRLWLDIRYQYSMLKIRTREFINPYTTPQQRWTRDQYNNVISIRLSYYFNQEILVRKPRQKSGG